MYLHCDVRLDICGKTCVRHTSIGFCESANEGALLIGAQVIPIVILFGDIRANLDEGEG